MLVVKFIFKYSRDLNNGHVQSSIYPDTKYSLKETFRGPVEPTENWTLLSYSIASLILAQMENLYCIFCHLNTVGARIPNPFENRTFLGSVLGWFGFRMVRS